MVYAPIEGKITQVHAYRPGHPLRDKYRAVVIEGKDGTMCVMRYAMMKREQDFKEGEEVFKKGTSCRRGASSGEHRASEDGRMLNHVHVEKYRKGRRVDPTPDLEWWMGQRRIY